MSRSGRAFKIFFSRFAPIYPYFCSLSLTEQREVKIKRKKKFFFFRFFSKCRNATWVFFPKNRHCEFSSDPRGLKINLDIVFATLFPIKLIPKFNSEKVKKYFISQNFGPNWLSEFGPKFWKKFFFRILGVRPCIWKIMSKNIPRPIFRPLGSLESSQWRFFRKKTQRIPRQKLLSRAF